MTWWSNRDVLPQNMMATCYPYADYPEDPYFTVCEGDIWCQVVNFSRYKAELDGKEPYQGDLAFKAFGTMGIERYDGTPKSQIHPRWQEILQLPKR